jgi:methionyl-tRNA formyltransferase
VWNLMRGADPQPGAWSTYQGQTVQLYDAQKLPGAPTAAPGEVTTVEAESFTVATQGGQIAIRRVRPADGAKVPAAAFIMNTGLHKGVRLGT